MYFSCVLSREHINWWGNHTARLQPSQVCPKKKELKCPNTVILKDLYELFRSFLASVYFKVQASCGYKIFMDKTGIDR